MPTLPPDSDDPAATLLTTAQAAAAAHVDPEVIRQWAARRRIVAVDHRDGPLYRELDVLQAEADTRRPSREQRLAAEALRELGEHPA